MCRARYHVALLALEDRDIPSMPGPVENYRRYKSGNKKLCECVCVCVCMCVSVCVNVCVCERDCVGVIGGGCHLFGIRLCNMWMLLSVCCYCVNQ